MKRFIALMFVAAFLGLTIVSCAPKEGSPEWIVKKIFLFDGGDFSEIRDYFIFGFEEPMEEMDEQVEMDPETAAMNEQLLMAQEEELEMIWREVTREYTVTDVVIDSKKIQDAEARLVLNITFESGQAEEGVSVVFYKEDDQWKMSID